jgi:flavin reductase (DIM6/NTAB) family NADH-FMN oxidoreductase RutF
MPKRSFGPKTMVFPHPVFVIGSYGADGMPNIATAAWAGICCSAPPAVAVSWRPSRLTYENVVARGAFTVNIPGTAHVRQADYAGMHSGREGDKFEALGLTPVRSAWVDAPAVGEFPVVLHCRLLHSFELGCHTQQVGEILELEVEEAALDDQGRPDIRRIDPLIYAMGDRGYYSVGAFVARAFSVGREGR